jgi:hypothetical protein
MPSAALVGFFTYKLTVLPGSWGLIAPAIAIVVLLLWAGRLMLHSETAEDIAAELPSEEELRSPSYGFQVQQTTDEEIIASRQK